MLILGIILIIIGAVTNIPVLYSIGVVLAIIGLVLIVLGLLGREVGGRRHLLVTFPVPPGHRAMVSGWAVPRQARRRSP
jgi:hypothetical protein